MGTQVKNVFQQKLLLSRDHLVDTLAGAIAKTRGESEPQSKGAVFNLINIHLQMYGESLPKPTGIDIRQKADELLHQYFPEWDVSGADITDDMIE